MVYNKVDLVLFITQHCPANEQEHHNRIKLYGPTTPCERFGEVHMQGNISRRSQAVILTASEIEYKAVRSHLSNLSEDTHRAGTVYQRGIFAGGKMRWEVGIAQIELGNTVAAFEAQRAIDHFNPVVVLFVGTAYGLKDVRLGDVVAATKVYGYESGKAEQSTFLTRPIAIEPSYALIQRASATRRDSNWQQRIRTPLKLPHSPDVLLGPIAAGEPEIHSSHSPLVALIHSTYEDALAVERTGSGFLRATHSNEQTRALIICGISQLVDNGQSAAAYDTRNYQAIAASHASAFAFEVLAKFELEDRQPNKQQITATNNIQSTVTSNIQSKENLEGESNRQKYAFKLPDETSIAPVRSRELNELIVTFATVILLALVIIGIIIFVIIHFL